MLCILHTWRTDAAARVQFLAASAAPAKKAAPKDRTHTTYTIYKCIIHMYDS